LLSKEWLYLRSSQFPENFIITAILSALFVDHRARRRSHAPAGFNMFAHAYGLFHRAAVAFDQPYRLPAPFLKTHKSKDQHHAKPFTCVIPESWHLLPRRRHVFPQISTVPDLQDLLARIRAKCVADTRV